MNFFINEINKNNLQIITKRIFDIILLIVFIIFSFAPIIIISFLIKITSPGPILFWSKRIGKDENLFSMPKFRTMKISTPIVATDKLLNPEKHLTNFGKILRKSSLDELPQLICILKGEMSFVGPRPALYNQKKLIKKRREKGINKILPGLTGWAQINGRDNITNREKVKFDKEYLDKQSLFFDCQIILRTFIRLFLLKEISH